MINFKTLTDPGQLKGLSLEETNKYIQSWGKKLLTRYRTVERAKDSIARTNALRYNAKRLSDVITNVGLGARPTAKSGIKYFSDIEEAHARMFQLATSLQSRHSTITTERQALKSTYSNLRNTIGDLVGEDVAKKLTYGQLEELREVFKYLDDDDIYNSNLVINEYISLKDSSNNSEEKARQIEEIISAKYGIKRS